MSGGLLSQRGKTWSSQAGRIALRAPNKFHRSHSAAQPDVRALRGVSTSTPAAFLLIEVCRSRFSRVLFNLVVAFIGIAGFVFIAGCTQAPLAQKIPVMESGIEVNRFSSVFWVPPNEVMFLAPTDEHAMDGTFRKRVSRVTTWNVRTRDMKRFARADAGLCYDGGNVAYREVENSTLRDWTTFGRHPDAVKREERAVLYDEFVTCVPYDVLPQPPARDVEHVFVRLRPEHGFIDLGPAKRWTENTPIRLYKPGSSEGIELPFKRRELERGTVKYYAFKGAYFIESVYYDRALGYETSPWPANLPRPVWWLYPDGRVETSVIPYAKWMRRRIVPTRAGLLALDKTFFTITGEAPFDGVYLIDGKGGTRLMRGVFEATDVSPDGCRLAGRRAVEPGVRRPEFWTMTVLALCKEQR